MPFPTTLDELRNAGYRFIEHARCAGCPAVIEWWSTPAGKRMPMDVTDSGKVQAHWASCKNPDLFRRKHA